MNNGKEDMNEEKSKQIMEYVPFGAQDAIRLTIRIVREFIAVPTKSGKEPTDRDVFRFMAMCRARKLNPYEGDAYLIGYDGHAGPTFSLITAHQAFLKRAELNPEYDGMESGAVVERDGQVIDIQGDFTDSGDKLLGGWARVFFRTRSHPMYKRIRLQRFRKGFGVWQDDPAGMICKCAEADALRSSFPTMLGGLFTQEEGIGQNSAIEIMEPTIQKVEISGGRESASPKEQPKADLPAPKPTLSGTEEAAPKAPARKKKAKLEVKEPPQEIQTFRSRLNRRLKAIGYSEEQFLAVANYQEWLGKGRTWNSMDDVPDEMFELFLADEEWLTVRRQLEAAPRHVKD
jgi:phage recombination protein Bet